MSYGLQVLNNSGGVLLDDILPQMHLVESGTAAGQGTWTGPGTYGAVFYSRNITNPQLYVRSALNSRFFVFSHGEGQFLYKSDAALEWRVYEGTAPTHTPSDYGINVYSPSGVLLFDVAKSFPLIAQNSVVLTAADRGTYGFIRNINHTVTANDGGLPFASAPTFMQMFTYKSYTEIGFYSLVARHASATALEIHQLLGFSTAIPYSQYALVYSHACGIDPRNVLFIK